MTITHTLKQKRKETERIKIKSKKEFKQASEKLLYLRMYECWYEYDLQRKW